MKKQITYLFIVLIGLNLACKSPQEKEKHQTEMPESAVGIPHHSEGSTGVKLNSGEKWVANSETTTGIDNMIKLVAQYQREEDAILLKEKLESEFQMIFQKCTMTGEAHEQLHNYLIPLKGKIAHLGTNPYADNIKELKEYLAEYKEYYK